MFAHKSVPHLSSQHALARMAKTLSFHTSPKKIGKLIHFPGLVDDEEKQVLKLLPQINFANMKLLQGLPAIGPKTAYLIQSYR